jgi:nucleoside-diphosphate-sugar epimerase
MSVLVLGGAGYIGSHTALELIRAGEEVVIVTSVHHRIHREPKAFSVGMFLLSHNRRLNSTA